MANYANLLATIAANIYTNGHQEVTAEKVKTAINAAVNSLGAGYQFMGVAHPADMPSGYADLRAFWLAGKAGTYTNFGGLVLNDGEVAVIKYDGNGWSKDVVSILDAIVLKPEAAIGGFYMGVYPSGQTAPNTEYIIVKATFESAVVGMNIALATGTSAASVTTTIYTGAVAAGTYFWKVPYNGEANIRFYSANVNPPYPATYMTYVPDMIDKLYAESLGKLGLPQVIDASPTAGSNNFVRSGGVKTETEKANSNLALFTNTEGSTTSDRSITSSSYLLVNGGAFLIKFSNWLGSANNATLKIGNATRYPIYYNGKPANNNNTWASGEIVRVFFDGSNYQAERLNNPITEYDFDAEVSVSASSQTIATFKTNFLKGKFDIVVDAENSTAVISDGSSYILYQNSVNLGTLAIVPENINHYNFTSAALDGYYQLQVRPNRVTTAGKIKFRVIVDNIDQALLEAATTELNNRINEVAENTIAKDQGASNFGKVLIIGADGRVVPGEGGGQDPTANSVVEHIAKTLYLGANLLNNPAVVLGTGWSGSLSSGFTHTPGNTGIIEIQQPTISGKKYLIECSLSSAAEASIYLSIGNGPLVDVYNGTTTIRVGFVSDGGYLKITPASSFDGSVSNVTLKEIVSADDAVETLNINVRNIENGTMVDNVTGFWNVVLGTYNTMQHNQNGSRNIVLGYSAMGAFKSGTRNIMIGTFAGANLESGDRNISIGADSLYFVQKGADNISIGYAAMGRMQYSQQNNNIAIGSQSLGYSDSTASDNIAIGQYACYYSGNHNVGIGVMALYWNKGINNTAVGYRANASIYLTGEKNVAIGTYSSCGTQGASSLNPNVVNNAIAIGYQATATKSNQVVIGNADHTEFVLGTKKLIFNQDGSVQWETIS